MNQEYGLSFKVVNGDTFAEDSPTIRRLVKAYLETVEDKFSVDEIMDILSLGANDKGLFILLAFLSDGYGVGLMTAHAVQADLKAGGMIHIGYVDGLVVPPVSKEIIAEAMNQLTEWAKRNEMKSVYAQTTRGERAFDKLLIKHGWTRYTTVYEKGIDYGRPETSQTDASRPVTTGV